ncbi:MAG: acyloxyacyl hydrolase [Fusobacteriaceae bacterium]
MKKFFLLLIFTIVLGTTVFSKEYSIETNFLKATNNSSYLEGNISAVIPVYEISSSFYVSTDPFINIGKNYYDYGVILSLNKTWHISEKWFALAVAGIGIMNLENDSTHQHEGFNFKERIGLGVGYEINENSSLTLLGSIGHISNAGLNTHNSGLDGYSLGIRYSFKF